MGSQHETAPYAERREREVAAAPEVLWQVVAGIGGDAGWYAVDALWCVRAGVDRLLGGPGMRGRRPGVPRVGDELDFWRVEAVDPPRSLRLRAEMRMPGTAWLGLEIEPCGVGGSRLVQRTWFAPDGVLGHAFWWAELPGHKAVFARMCDGIAAEASRRAARG